MWWWNLLREQLPRPLRPWLTGRHTGKNLRYGKSMSWMKPRKLTVRGILCLLTLEGSASCIQDIKYKRTSERTKRKQWKNNEQKKSNSNFEGLISTVNFLFIDKTVRSHLGKISRAIQQRKQHNHWWSSSKFYYESQEWSKGNIVLEVYGMGSLQSIPWDWKGNDMAAMLMPHTIEVGEILLLKTH